MVETWAFSFDTEIKLVPRMVIVRNRVEVIKASIVIRVPRTSYIEDEKGKFGWPLEATWGGLID